MQISWSLKSRDHLLVSSGLLAHCRTPEKWTFLTFYTSFNESQDSRPIPISNDLMSGVFLQRQKWIVNYYVKKFIKKAQ